VGIVFTVSWKGNNYRHHDHGVRHVDVPHIAGAESWSSFGSRV
jgi:hypothetical protein